MAMNHTTCWVDGGGFAQISLAVVGWGGVGWGINVPSTLIPWHAALPTCIIYLLRVRYVHVYASCALSFYLQVGQPATLTTLVRVFAT